MLTIVVMVISNFIDLTGQKFGKLIVVNRDGYDKSKSIIWLCKCECGKYVHARGKDLKKGKIKSCGCYRKQKAKERNIKDLTGQQFGKLTAVKQTTNRQHRNIIWMCQCECGNVIYIPTYYLTSGQTTSCGCYKKEKLRNKFMNDLTGQKYGMLTVEKYVKSIPYIGPNWLCQCECGKKKVIASRYLVSGRIKTCGCGIMSTGERKVRDVLDSNQIRYIFQYCIYELQTKNRGHPVIDFAIMCNDKPLAFIEYQGIQHYKDLGEFGKQQREETDKMKINYCEEKRIPFFEIRYDEEIAPAVKKILSTLKLIPCQAS